MRPGPGPPFRVEHVRQGEPGGRRPVVVDDAHNAPAIEALTAASVALLTLYDMAKALDRAMVIGDIRLLEKSGGRSGDWRAA